MPFQRPSLATLNRRAATDIDGELSGTEPRLRRSLLGALARALAGAVDGLYAYGGWIAKQIFATSADEAQLLVQAAEWGIGRIAAKKASGTLTTTGVAGTAIPIDTLWQSAAGQQYRSTAAASVGAVPVEAVTAGSAGNAADGAKVSLLSPIAGVVSTAVAAAGLTGGADIESIEALRARLLYRKRNPPRGGAKGDYILWADAARVGAHRVWEAPLSQMRSTDPVVLGTVIVYYAPDDIPLQDTGHWDTADAEFVAAIAEVSDYIQERRPIDAANIDVRAPLTQPFNITIVSVTPDTPAIRAAIEASVTDLLLRETEPGGTLLLSHIREAISAAEGETDHNLTVPAANVVAPQHTILTMGSITWQ